MDPGPTRDAIRQAQDADRNLAADPASPHFDRALAEGQTGPAWEGHARRCHLAFDYPGAITSYERAYAAYRGEGDMLAAARCARTVGWFRGSLYGDWAVYSGWLDRGNALLAMQTSDRQAAGWLLLTEAQRGNDLERQRSQYLEVIGLARDTGDSDLECDALASLGIMLVLSGISDGMRYLDEALAAVCAGDVQELSIIESVMCGLFNACERTHDVIRAEQWLRSADALVRRQGLVALGGYCRAYYGGILTAAGRWDEAEKELRTALDTFRPDHVAVRQSVLSRLAALRLMQGRREEAAELLVGLENRDDAIPTIAALHLERGEPTLAIDLIERTISTRSLEDAFEGPLLATLADAHLSAGSPDKAELIVGRLETLADRQSGQYLRAVAALARGKVCLSTGAGDVRDCLQRAMAAFSSLELPVDTARARLVLAEALATTGKQADAEVAVSHARAALTAFQQFSAARDVDRATSLLRSLGAPQPASRSVRGNLTGRESEVLRLLGHGLTNAQIAERLFISPKTAEHHVARVLAKLGLRSRAQVAAYVARTRGSDKPGVA